MQTFIYDSTPRFVHLYTFNPSRYTGKERDTESGLDYFPARYYGSNVGRWMSPDPSGLYFAVPENPQTLNLYSYVGNNPLRYTDPTGLCGGAAPAGESLLGKIGGAISNVFCSLFGGNSNNSSSPGAQGGGGSSGNSGGGAGMSTPLFSTTVRMIPPAEFGSSNGNMMNRSNREASLFRFTPPGMATAYIYFTYRTGGPGDVKSKMWMANDDINGQTMLTPDSYMDFGNLGYGEAARAAGLPEGFVQRAPGLAHQHDLTHSWGQAFWNSFLSGAPFGDQQRDQHYVSGDRSAYKDPTQ